MATLLKTIPGVVYTDIGYKTTTTVWTFKLEVKEDNINIEENKSNVIVDAYIGRNSSNGDGWMKGAVITCPVTVGSETKTIIWDRTNTKDTFKAGEWRYLGSATFEVKHESTGSKTVNVSATFTNDPVVKPGSGKASDTVTLSTIARASTIQASDAIIGNVCSITITSASSNYRHKLEYTFGSKNEPIAENIVDSYNWSVPSYLSSEIKSGSSGIGTLKCITYNGSTKVGEVSIPVTFSISSRPTVNKHEIKLINPEKINNCGVYLSGYSKVNITAEATASDGAEIESYTVMIGGLGSKVVDVAEENNKSLDYTSSALTSSGEVNIKLSVKDSRGLTCFPTFDMGKINVLKYTDPDIKTFIVSRKENDQSLVTVKCNWEHMYLGDGVNTSKGKILYKDSLNGKYKDSASVITNGVEITLNETFDVTKSYYFKLVVTDVINEINESDGITEKEEFITTRKVLMDFRAGGKGLSIGKISEADIFEVAMDSQFDNPTTFKQQVIEEYGHYAHLTWAGYEKTGYVRIAKMKVTSAWNDAYLVFDVMQRHKTFSTYYVGFQHADHAYPEIDTFTYEGDMPGYLVKVTEGEWDLIVQKKERNDFICVVDFKNNPYTNGRTEITWLDVYDAELPTGAIISTPRKQNNVLWSGGNVGAYMSAKKIDEETYETQKCDLSKTPISQQPNGIVLVFSQFDQANNKGLENYMSFFVPKQLVAAQPGATHTFQLNTYNYSAMGTKYLKISDTLIEGDIVNEDVGYIDSGKTVLFANNKFVLRYIYGV